ncbi:hypothetical protein INT43_007236 [Umbelopsis isabellina]|uniref:Uncharacterized protein n=1 Tax=Mortierella isabellina TaxID=91625 RepID=A0A8H7PX90_MORIS|nr:hypothetical protein INT43_007236 [Umbelopsis isabellina]
MNIAKTTTVFRSIVGTAPRMVVRSYSMIPSTPHHKAEGVESLSESGGDNNAFFLKSMYERDDSRGSPEDHHQTIGSQSGTQAHQVQASQGSHESLAPRVNTVFED